MLPWALTVFILDKFSFLSFSVFETMHLCRRYSYCLLQKVVHPCRQAGIHVYKNHFFLITMRYFLLPTVPSTWQTHVQTWLDNLQHSYAAPFIFQALQNFEFALARMSGSLCLGTHWALQFKNDSIIPV